jgi:two-component system, NarL family, nitrate/nitrite response regulator NarL
MSVPRVLIADSLSIFRAGVRKLLLREGFDAVEASDLDGTLRLGVEQRPEIALVDLDLPPFGGIVAVHQLVERTDAYPILWSFAPTQENVLTGIRAGAYGFLRKEISPHGLVDALHGALKGEAPLARELTTLMIDALHGLDERQRARERLAALSPRELQVLDHVAHGARNRQIAATLTISEFTVKRHVQNILEKLDVGSRRAAATVYGTAYDVKPLPARRIATIAPA